MENEIPNIVDELYRYFVTQPAPRLWPDHLQSSPIQGHGLWSFYQGLRQLKYAGKDWAVLVFFLVIAVLVGVLGHFGL